MQPRSPAYKNPYAPYDAQKRDANIDVGGPEGMKRALAVKAAMKNNGYMDTHEPRLDAPLEFEDMDFDTSDSPREPMPARRKGPPSAVPVRRDPALANRGTSHNPGMPPQRRMRNEGPNDATPPPGQQQKRPRPGSQTVQITPQRPQTQTQQVSSSGKWDVSLPDGRVVRIPASDAATAQKTAGEWLRQNPSPTDASGGGNPAANPENSMQRPANVDFSRLQVTPAPNESTTAGSIGAGTQAPSDRQLSPEGLRIFSALVNQRLQEIVRKKKGGGGFALYAPNKGKKKNAKPVGDFPTRYAAKRVELSRFPPKDPEALKKARRRLDKLAKDPKKRQEKEKSELSAKKPKRSGRAAGERKARKEALITRMANELTERLFHEEELPGSPWDERISGLHPDALSQDKKLHRYHQGMEKASLGALGDGHKSLARVLRGIAKVHPGDVARDSGRGKMFMPLTLDVDGEEIGPVHLYIDGGHVCIEVSSEAREAIGGLEPNQAKNLRGGLMSFQEDHLPKIDKAQQAWNERDTYLDKLHQRLEKTVGGLSPIELHLAKQMMAKRRR
jgi:hypothetical protein